MNSTHSFNLAAPAFTPGKYQILLKPLILAALKNAFIALT